MNGPTELHGTRHILNQGTAMSNEQSGRGDARTGNIPLAIERLRELFCLDAESGTLRWRIRPTSNVKAGSAAGHKNREGYLHVQVDGKKLQVHRIVFALVNGFSPPEIDHVNGIRTDNRPINLRAANRAQNEHNKGLQRNNSSGVKGVYWSARNGKWIARCNTNGRRNNVGHFRTLEDASEAIRTFREQHHKEFARHGN